MRFRLTEENSSNVIQTETNLNTRTTSRQQKEVTVNSEKVQVTDSNIIIAIMLLSPHIQPLISIVWSCIINYSLLITLIKNLKLVHASTLLLPKQKTKIKTVGKTPTCFAPERGLIYPPSIWTDEQTSAPLSPDYKNIYSCYKHKHNDAHLIILSHLTIIIGNCGGLKIGSVIPLYATKEPKGPEIACHNKNQEAPTRQAAHTNGTLRRNKTICGRRPIKSNTDGDDEDGNGKENGRDRLKSWCERNTTPIEENALSAKPLGKINEKSPPKKQLQSVAEDKPTPYRTQSPKNSTKLSISPQNSTISQPLQNNQGIKDMTILNGISKIWSIARNMSVLRDIPPSPGSPTNLLITQDISVPNTTLDLFGSQLTQDADQNQEYSESKLNNNHKTVQCPKVCATIEELQNMPTIEINITPAVPDLYQDLGSPLDDDIGNAIYLKT